MSFWVVRAGQYGEQEDAAFSRNVVTVGWNEVPDLRSFGSREALRATLQQIYPNEKAQKLNVWTAQLWAFCNLIKEDDLVALPLKRDGVVAFGRIAGGYRFAVDEGGHEIPVEWNDERVARHRIPQDIRYSLGSTLTVFQVRRNDAEARIRRLLSGIELIENEEPSSVTPEPIEEETLGVQDIERAARDQIINYIGMHFKEHGLEMLVEEILKADGFTTDRTQPGPDGGVDILAGRGILGVDPPRIAVQVKSSSSPSDVNSIRQLQGVMGQFHADFGLFVSWGGFKGTAPKDARREFFKLRLWNSETLLDELLRVYDRLPKGLQTDLPLKRVWTLVENRD